MVAPAGPAEPARPAKPIHRPSVDKRPYTMPSYKNLAGFTNWSGEEKDQFCLNVIKGLIMDGVRNANSGHTGGPMSSADFAYLLFSEYLRFDPADPAWFARDRFVLSAGHESMLLYSLLYLTGWLEIEDLQQFRQLHSRTPGHPEVETPGVEATTGPLGQGVGMGTGMAVAEEILRAQAARHLEGGEKLVGHYTYILASDGDLQEPVALGTAALAGHWKLSRLILFYDSNAVQISGQTSRADSTDMATVFEGLQWHVQEVNGHDHTAVREAIERAQVVGRPSIIIGTTVMAQGAASMEGDHETHGAPLPREEIDATKENLGLPPEQFYLPPVVREHFQRRFAPLREEVAEWRERLQGALENAPFKTFWEQAVLDRLPSLEWPDFEGEKALATRKAFGMTLDKFAPQVPHLVGGSADLEPSNYTGSFAAAYGDFQSDNRQGRNFAFGVREFPMAAIMNGMSLHGGVIPFGGTFLVFADYERPALRLAALQAVRVVHEFTHDSFYVGEDGPTHQPVEQAMALRAIPNFNVFRPADAKETAAAFEIALQSTSTPSALLLTRQGVPVLPQPAGEVAAGVAKGAYPVRDCEGEPELLLIATGSEVSLALEVAEQLDNRRVRVVSMPCWELFEAQPEEYQDSLIPRNGCLKVSLEAGVTVGWERYVGRAGLTIGLNRFGSSAPYKDLAREFGFTTEQVLATIRQYLKSRS